MATDTKPLAPTDAEIIALADETRTAEGGASGYILPISFARAVLAKWGTPPAVAGEQVAWQQGSLTTMNQDPYPALGKWFVQFWEGDDVAARVYGNDAETLQRRCTAIATTQPAPQQEAQEPVMIYHGDCTIDCGEHGHHHVELLRMIPAGSKLYTAPQPSPASQGDALDAARLDWLLLHISGAEFRRIGVHYSGNASRADVDAARKQGANHD